MSPKSDSLTVRIGASEYAKKWRFLSSDGSTNYTYQMSADRSRIVFSPDFGGGNNEDIVIGRGLIKWYCASQEEQALNGAKSKKKKKKGDTRRCHREEKGNFFFLEISTDCALGTGGIDIYCMEQKVDLLKWINSRFFPSKSETIFGGLTRCISTVWKSVKHLFSALIPKCCKTNKSQKEKDKNSMSLMEIVERRGSSVASSFSSIRRKKRRSSSNPPPPPTSVPEIVQDCHSFSSNDPDEGKRHLRKQAYSLDLSEEGVDASSVKGGGLEVDVAGDPLSRTQSLNVKFRRRESMKKLKKNVGKVWKSLSYSSRLQIPTNSPSSELPTYRSFEEIDVDFHFDDDKNGDHSKDCDFCADNRELENVSHQKEDKIERIFNRNRLSSYLDACNPDEIGNIGDDGLKMFSISDEGFDTLSGDDEEEEEEYDDGTEKEQGEVFLTKSWYEHRKSDKKDSKTSKATPVAFDDTDGTVIVVDAMDIYKVPRTPEHSGHATQKAPTPEGTSDEYDKCDNESSTGSSASGVDQQQIRVRSASTGVKYIDQSASLVSLRSTSAVSSAIARFDALSDTKK